MLVGLYVLHKIHPKLVFDVCFLSSLSDMVSVLTFFSPRKLVTSLVYNSYGRYSFSSLVVLREALCNGYDTYMNRFYKSKLHKKLSLKMVSLAICNFMVATFSVQDCLYNLSRLNQSFWHSLSSQLRLIRALYLPGVFNGYSLRKGKLWFA